MQFPGAVKAQKAHCKPTFSGNCNSTQVDLVKVGSFSNSSTTCATGAIDTSHITAGKPLKLYRGKTYDLRVEATSSAFFGVWLDFNGDGDFNDAGETIVVIQLGNSDTVVSNIRIPVNAKLLKTRMRAIASSGTNTDIQGACGSYTNGEAEDYYVEIAAYDDDVSMVSIAEPRQRGCGSSTQPLKVVVRNMGYNTVTSIPVTVKVNSSSYTQTFSKTLKQDEQDTLTFTSTANTSSAGNYAVSAYTSLSKDEDKTNDSVSSELTMYQTPSITSPSNQSRCGLGTFTFTATSSTTGTKTFWYKDATSDSVIHSGNSFTTPGLNKTTTYYYESQYNVGGSLTTRYLSGLQNYGTMFDIKTKSSFIIDSFDTHIESTATNDSVMVFYKEGTYLGSETNSSAWKYVGTTHVKAAGRGSATRVRGFGSIPMEAGKTYAVYLAVISNGGNVYHYNIVTRIYSNKDLDLVAGATNNGLFGTVTPNRSFDGTVYYHYKACASPRGSVTGTVNESPLGAKIKETTPFQGLLYDGSFTSPDLVCPGDTITYEFTPPPPYSNKDLGTKWEITGFSFKTVNGANPNAKDTATTQPTATQNATFRFVPSKAYGDSTFALKIDLKMKDGGCTGSLVRYISVGSKPTANFTFTRVCVGKTTNFADSSQVPPGAVSYVYDFGNGAPVARTRNTTHTYAKAGKYNVTLTLVTSRGCSDHITREVEVYDLPKAKFGASTVCVGTPTQFTDSSVNANDIASWLWRFDMNDASTSTQKNPTFTYGAAGKYTVKLVVTSKGGCKDSFTRTIEVMPKPKVDFAVKGGCLGQAFTFTNTTTIPSGTVTYRWRFEDGFTSTSDKEVKHTFAEASQYGVTLIATSSFGCVDSITKIVSAFPLPKADFTSSPTCEGKVMSFTDASTDAKNYTWTWGDNSLPSSSKNPTKFFAKAGTYTVKLRIESANGCVDSITKNVTVSPLPKAGFTFGSACAGGPVQLTNTSTEGNNAKLTYQWSTSNGLTSTDKDPVFTFANSGNYSVKLRVVSEAGCVDSTQLTIPVSSVAKPKWSRIINMNNKREVTFTPDVTTHQAYKWYFGDGDSSTQVSPTHTYAVFGSYNVRLVITTSQGCRSETSDTLRISSNSIGIAEGNKLKDFVKVYPNPFMNSTRVAFTLAERSQVQVSIWDVQGRQVAVLADGKRDAGKHEYMFDADKYNAGAGVYILKVLVNDNYYTTQIVNVK